MNKKLKDSTIDDLNENDFLLKIRHTEGFYYPEYFREEKQPEDFTFDLTEYTWCKPRKGYLVNGKHIYYPSEVHGLSRKMMEHTKGTNEEYKGNDKILEGIATWMFSMTGMVLHDEGVKILRGIIESGGTR